MATEHESAMRLENLMADNLAGPSIWIRLPLLWIGMKASYFIHFIHLQ